MKQIGIFLIAILLGCHPVKEPVSNNKLDSGINRIDKPIKEEKQSMPRVFKILRLDSLKKEIEKCSKTKNDTLINCEDFELVYTTYSFNRQESLYSSSINKDSMLGIFLQGNLCTGIKTAAEINRETDKKEDRYGSWMFRFESVGTKYYVIRGCPIINSDIHINYYYMKMKN